MVTGHLDILLFFHKLLYCCSITVVCIFSPPLPHTPSKPTSLPCFHPTPWFCPCVLYSSSYNPLSSVTPYHSPWSIVRLFLTSMSLVIFCLLFSSIAYVPVKGFSNVIAIWPHLLLFLATCCFLKALCISSLSH